MPGDLETGAAQWTVADVPAAPGRAHDGVGDGQSETGARPWSVARWNRSNSRARSSAGIPGPLSSTARLTPLPRSYDDANGTAAPGIATGVVHQDPGEAVDPLRRRADPRLGVALPDHRDA